MRNIIRAGITSEEALKISFRDLNTSSYDGLWKTLLELGRFNDALCAAEEGRAQALVDGLKTQYGVAEIPSVSLDAKETISFISDRLPTTVFLAHQHSAVSFWIISKGSKVKFRKNAVQGRHVDEDSITVLLESTLKNMRVHGRVLCENCDLDYDGDNDNDNNDENNEGDGDIHHEGGGDNGDDDNDHGNDYNDKDNDEGDGNRGGYGDNPDIDNDDHDDDGDDEKAEPLQCTNKLLQLVHDAIIGPIADLCQVDKLIIVPDGPLCSVPFSALSESIVIRTVPSLTSLKLITDYPADYDNVKGALLVGDPYLGERQSDNTEKRPGKDTIRK